MRALLLQRALGLATTARAFRATPAAGRVYDRITDTVGNTPVVRLNKLAPPGVEVFAKLEYFNPLSSVRPVALLLARGGSLQLLLSI